MERALFEIIIVIATAVIAHLETKRRLTKNFESILTKMFKSYGDLLDEYETQLTILKNTKK